MVAHHPQWQRVRQWINDGKIGKLSHVQGVFTYFNDDMQNIRNHVEFGGGALPDIGVYPTVTTRLATGAEPVTCTSRITWQNGVDTTSRVLAEFPDFTLDFYVSMRMALKQQMVFHGEEAVLTVHAPFNPKGYGPAVIEIRYPDGSRISETFETADQYVNQFDAFNETVLTGANFPCPLEFSKDNQKMIDMIYAGEIKQG